MHSQFLLRAASFQFTAGRTLLACPSPVLIANTEFSKASKSKYHRNGNTKEPNLTLPVQKLLIQYRACLKPCCHFYREPVGGLREIA